MYLISSLRYHALIFHLQAKNASIISKERDVTVAVDDEPIGVLPATFQVIKNVLNLSM
jgi:diacylglycerol kinase (ATP)